MNPGIHYKLAAVFAGLAAFVAILAIFPISSDEPDGNNKDIAKAELQAPATSATTASPVTLVSTKNDKEPLQKAAAPTATAQEQTSQTVPTATTGQQSATAEPERQATLPTQTEPLPSEQANTEPRTGHHPELEKKLVGLLKPIVSKTISDSDKKNLNAALSLTAKKKFTKAKKAYKAISDPDARNLANWYGIRLKWSDMTYGELAAYRQAHLDWPSADRIRAEAEAKLYLANAPAPKVLAFFKDEAPISGPGKTALTRALMADGQKDKAKEILKDAWRNHDLTKTTANEIAKKFSKHLSREDHLARVDRFLFRGKKKHIAPAMVAAKFLGKKDRKLIDARVAEIQKSRKTAKLIDALSDKEKKDLGIIFARARWALKRKKRSQAWKIITEAPAPIENEVPADGWWKMLRKQVFTALDAKQYKTAYELARRHGPLTVNKRNDALFIAGWVALRYLKKPELAEPHFKAFIKSADGPRTRGKSNYWMGRTALALGQSEKAKQHFAEGAKEYHTYYGQLSLRAISGDNDHLDIPPPPKPSQESIDRFMNRSAVRALVVAHLIERQDLENRFFTHLRYHINDPGELVLLAELAKAIDNTQRSLRIGKRGMFLRQDLAHYAYPTHSMPKFKALRSLPEQAFIYGITRQESEFNPAIISHAGARGLMQLMPGTAREVSRRYKLKYKRAKLISNPSYNVSVASAYISSGLDDFSGSYIMTIAGYNAGPGRVRQWVRQFGDPRKKSIDPIDWIERIPFYETRNYVMKVLANIQMYRARLGEPQKALRVVRDLYRARNDVPSQPFRATN